MRLKHYPTDKFKADVLRSIEKELDLKTYRVFIFGSRVNERGDERSDIDIGIEGPKIISSASLAKIKESFDALPVLYKIDVVDFKQVAPSFRKVALKHIEPLN